MCIDIIGIPNAMGLRSLHVVITKRHWAIFHVPVNTVQRAEKNPPHYISLTSIPQTSALLVQQEKSVGVQVSNAKPVRMDSPTMTEQSVNLALLDKRY